MKYFNFIGTTERLILFLYVHVCSLDLSYQSPQETQCIRRQGWSNVAGYLTESAVDRFQCIRQCLKQEKCIAIQFNDSDNACTYYKWDQLKLTKSTTENGITFVRTAKVVAVQGTPRYQYDFTTASNACASFGGQLSKYADLRDAWQSGLSYCHCGWLSNGSRYYPFLKINNPGCIFGLTSCPHFSKADAWCSI